MSEQALKVGDVVRLKSGGPKMTVTEIGEDTLGRLTVWVSWFDPKMQTATNGSFPVAAVEK